MWFKGQFSQILDDKGRIAIPARLKEVMENRQEDCLVITKYEKCLWGFTRAHWQAIEDRVAGLDQFDTNVETLIHYFISGSAECPLKSGKITIPLNLRKFAGLEKDIVLVGSVSKIEIWAAERWEEKSVTSKTDFPAARQALANSGVLAGLGINLTGQ